MIPLGDDNPTLRTPVMTYVLLTAMALVWVFVQGAGMDPRQLAVSICNLGMVPGEITHQAPLGSGVPIGQGLACVVDNSPINIWTPLISMFLHGSWGHIGGNALFFWVFGNNVEDSMGRLRFLAFYIICGLIAAASQIAISPASPVPTVGASGAISGVLGAYLLLYPNVRVRMFFFLFIIPVRAWLVLLYWFAVQVIAGLPQLMTVSPEVSGGVAVWAHVGGFVSGMLLTHLFVNPELHRRRLAMGDASVVFHR